MVTWGPRGGTVQGLEPLQFHRTEKPRKGRCHPGPGSPGLHGNVQALSSTQHPGHRLLEDVCCTLNPKASDQSLTPSLAQCRPHTPEVTGAQVSQSTGRDRSVLPSLGKPVLARASQKRLHPAELNFGGRAKHWAPDPYSASEADAGPLGNMPAGTRRARPEALSSRLRGTSQGWALALTFGLALGRVDVGQPPSLEKSQAPEQGQPLKVALHTPVLNHDVYNLL